MPGISYLDCPHRNVQEYTEYCLDCGYNIYTTREQYLADLRRKNAQKSPSGVDETDPLVMEIRAAESGAGVVKSVADDEEYSTW